MKQLMMWIVQALVLIAMARLFPAIMVYDFTDAMAVIVAVAQMAPLVRPA